MSVEIWETDENKITSAKRWVAFRVIMHLVFQ